MTAISRSAFVSVVLALAAVAACASASAQTSHHRAAQKKSHALPRGGLEAQPLPPGVELQSSTSAATGSENHYFSDTVASGQNNLMDPSYRYGQASSARYNNYEPLFRF
jgi:curli biogenesis system outer membrane secretion channel CsgG